MAAKVCVGAFVLLTAGCVVESPHDRSYVSEQIRERTAYELGPVVEPGEFSMPAEVSLEDGLSLDEAVALALWNNAQLQGDFAALGFARADLVEANMLPNPVFTLLFPVGPKLLEARLIYPIDTFWQRPRRIEAAKLDAESMAQRLIEHGLRLIRDVGENYVDLWLAQQRAQLTEQEAQLRSQLAHLAQRRLAAGDISELASSAAQVDSLRATEAARSVSKNATLLKRRLRALLGLVSDDPAFDILPPVIDEGSTLSIQELLDVALLARPDLRAAELGIEAAGERLGWERSKILNFILWIDGKDKGEEFLEVGPGFAVEIPVFNQNNARIARAQADLETAVRQYEVTRQRIIIEVHEAHTAYALAQEQSDVWRTNVIPALEDADRQTHKSFAAGEISYSHVLEAKSRLLEARLRHAELVTDLFRSIAQLNYRVGKRVSGVRS